MLRAMRRHPHGRGSTHGGLAARAWVGATLALLPLLVMPREASAHTVGLSSGTYELRGATVHARVTFARAELPEGGRSARDRLAALEVQGDGIPCARGEPLFEIDRPDGGTASEDGLAATVDFVCPSPPRRLRVSAGFVSTLSTGHRHIASVRGDLGAVDDVLDRGHTSFETGGSGARTAAEAFLSMVVQGVLHILSGADHLVFLLGVVLVGGRLRGIVLGVTAFTVAHSITLALAALAIVTPSPRLVEPAIALSIAYVGVENFFVKDAGRRWTITFPFGLVHGFGFAGTLRELTVAEGRVAPALLAFNAGVELGQLAVLALALPLLGWGRKRGWLDARVVKVLSAAIVVAGLAWFVARVL